MENKLDIIAKEISQCTLCELCQGTKMAVPGEGNQETKIVFIGEAPGRNEDLVGRPFVGRAGKFLDELLATAEMNRTGIWIGNMVKHRPPENRDPLPEELATCGTWLDKQLEILSPEVIVTLGRFSMAKFLPNVKISFVHGKRFLFKLNGKMIKVIPMYHPAAGLRNSNVANLMRADFLKLNELIKS